MSRNADITELLSRAQKGDRSSLDSLLPIVYEELRLVARRHLAGERSDHTLQATALVHEAYMRLLEQTEVDWHNRVHFFSIASQMMRRILVNYAVERNAIKRGSGGIKVQLDDAISFEKQSEQLDIVALDDALERLQKMDELQAKIVELRFFGGMTIEETAELLSISPSTVKREWQMAKAWLQVQMQN